MQAHTLAIALFLAQGCAPAAMVASAVRGNPDTGVVVSALRSDPDTGDGDACSAKGDDCGLGGGSTSSVILPLGIIVVAFAAPALIRYLLL